MPIFINGEVTKISLPQLIAEGKEIVERENIPASRFFDPDLSAASVAVFATTKRTGDRWRRTHVGDQKPGAGKRAHVESQRRSVSIERREAR